MVEAMSVRPGSRSLGLIRQGIWLMSIAVLLSLAACGDRVAPRESGASSPAGAVKRFLAPFAEAPGGTAGSTATKETKDFWASTCDHIDPLLRPRLRFYEDDPIDPQVNCGAAVVLLVMYTGDTGKMLPPTKIFGSPVSAETSADTSIVTVDTRYESPPALGAHSAQPPPSKARVKVLVVKREGSWWVATPQAFNPLFAAEGGLSESQLRDQHKKLLAAG